MTSQVVQDKPTAAYVLSLIGGILGLVVGFILLLIAASTPYYYYYSGIRVLYGGIGFWSLLCGIIVIVGAVKLNSNPLEHTKWGVIILVFSIIGLGSILGLIGGILALVYKPQTVAPQQPLAWSQHGTPQVITRICPQCGRVLSEDIKFCPYCGKELG
jgi:MFS family permease